MAKMCDLVHVRAYYEYEAGGEIVGGEECQVFLVTKVNADGTLQGARYNPIGAISWMGGVTEGTELDTWHIPEVE